MTTRQQWGIRAFFLVLFGEKIGGGFEENRSTYYRGEAETEI